MSNHPLESNDSDLFESRQALLDTLAAQGITDPAVLRAIAEVPREVFVPPHLRHRAYENEALAIEHGQTISQPYIVGLMTQALQLSKQHRVLEIGTGSGYQCAILATLAKEVYTVERIAELSAGASSLLDELHISNVLFCVGDGSLGWPEHAPYDRIIVTAAAPDVPPTLLDQLADHGILVMPIGAADRQALYAIHKRGEQIVRLFLCECRFVKLIGSEGWK